MYELSILGTRLGFGANPIGGLLYRRGVCFIRAVSFAFRNSMTGGATEWRETIDLLRMREIINCYYE